MDNGTDKKEKALELIDQLISLEKQVDLEYKKLLYAQKGEMVGAGDNIVVFHLKILKDLVKGL